MVILVVIRVSINLGKIERWENEVGFSSTRFNFINKLVNLIYDLGNFKQMEGNYNKRY